jgi:hypothetical protein
VMVMNKYGHLGICLCAKELPLLLGTNQGFLGGSNFVISQIW